MSFTGFNFGPKASEPAQTSNLFGSSTTTSQPQQTSNFFGTTAATQPQQSGGLFGTAQPQQTGGLFGSLAQNQPQQQQGGGLFGASTQQSGGGLFGSTATQQPQPQQTSSLFGGTIGQPQSQNQNQSSNLFGGLGAQSSQPKPSLSLFGNTTAQTSQPQQQQSSLFGTTTAAAPPTTSLFGNTTAAPAPSASLFGASRPPTALTLGQSLTAQNPHPQTIIPGVRIDISSLRSTTRFSELTEDLQRQIEALDTFIQQQISYADQCFALMPSHATNLSYISPDVAFVTQRLSTVELALDNDAQEIRALKEIVEKDAEDAKRSFRAVDNLKLPPQFHHNGMWSNAPTIRQPAYLSGATDDEDLRKSDLIPYFNNQVDTMAKTLDTYKQNVAEIEAHLKTVEANTLQQTQRMMAARGRDGANGKEDQIRELAAVLREFEGGILGVAGKVGEAREKVQEVVLGSSGIIGGGVGKNRARSYGRY